MDFRQRNQHLHKYPGGECLASLRSEGRLVWLDTGMKGREKGLKAETEGAIKAFAGSG